MAMSNYLSTAILNHVYRNTALSSPTTVYVALFSRQHRQTREVAPSARGPTTHAKRQPSEHPA